MLKNDKIDRLVEVSCHTTILNLLAVMMELDLLPTGLLKAIKVWSDSGRTYPLMYMNKQIAPAMPRVVTDPTKLTLV